MKILCLLVILANIFLFLWEYRTGALTTRKENPEQLAINGREPILLLQELKKGTHALPPSLNQSLPLDSTKPDGNLATQQNIKNTDPATANPTEYPKIKVP
jgi:hypothetical protein